jgi:DNA-binding response OmpR family regulator
VFVRDEPVGGRSNSAAMEALPLSILIIEDHIQTSHVMARLVRARGFAVEVAGSLTEARACIARGRVGFVISDLGLPDGSACEFMAAARDRHGLKGATISGYGMDGDIARSREAGFIIHLTKPIRMTELEEVLTLARHEIELRGKSPPAS